MTFAHPKCYLYTPSLGTITLCRSERNRQAGIPTFALNSIIQPSNPPESMSGSLEVGNLSCSNVVTEGITNSRRYGNILQIDLINGSPRNEARYRNRRRCVSVHSAHGASCIFHHQMEKDNQSMPQIPNPTSKSTINHGLTKSSGTGTRKRSHCSQPCLWKQMYAGSTNYSLDMCPSY